MALDAGIRDYEALVGHHEPDVALAIVCAAEDAGVEPKQLTPDQYLDWYELSPSTRPGVDEIFEHYGAWPKALAEAAPRWRELSKKAARELEERQAQEAQAKALAAKAQEALKRAKEGELSERIVAIESEHYGRFATRYDIASGKEETEVHDTQETRSLTVYYGDGSVAQYEMEDFYCASPYREAPPLAVRALWNEVAGYEIVSLEDEDDDEPDDSLED